MKENWISINQRIFDLEAKGELGKEWKKLIKKSDTIAGIVKRSRNEEDHRKAKDEECPEEGRESKDVLHVHGCVAQEETLL